MKQNNTDLEDTLQLPVLDDEYIEKSPKRLVFPFVAKLGIALSIVLFAGLLAYQAYDRMTGYRVELISDENISFSGVNGFGTIDSHFSPETKAVTYLKHRNKNGSLDQLIQSISCSFQQSDHLTNGMKVVYACRYDASAAQQAGYTIINTSRMYTVTGLSPSQLADPFEDLSTEWVYDKQEYTLRITPSQINQTLGFTYEYRTVSENRVLVIAKADDAVLQKYGYYVTDDRLHAYITIPDQPQYVTSSEPLQEEAYSAMHDAIAQSLSQCHSLSFGKESLPTDFAIQSVSFITDNTLQVNVQFHNIYSQNLQDYYSFTGTYEGQLLHHHDGSYSFILTSQKGCSFEGYGSSYTLQ